MHSSCRRSQKTANIKKYVLVLKKNTLLLNIYSIIIACNMWFVGRTQRSRAIVRARRNFHEIARYNHKNQKTYYRLHFLTNAYHKIISILSLQLVFSSYNQIIFITCMILFTQVFETVGVEFIYCITSIFTWENFNLLENFRHYLLWSR